MNWFSIEGSGSQTPAGRRAGGSDQMNGDAVMYDAGKILTVGGAPPAALLAPHQLLLSWAAPRACLCWLLHIALRGAALFAGSSNCKYMAQTGFAAPV